MKNVFKMFTSKVTNREIDSWFNEICLKHRLEQGTNKQNLSDGFILTYPNSVVCEKKEFEKFFYSTSVFSDNKTFNGCLGIDISSYVGNENDSSLGTLFRFVADNSSARYAFFTCNDDYVATIKLADRVTNACNCQLVTENPENNFSDKASFQNSLGY